MSTLTIIGEPLAEFEAPAHRAAANDLTNAIAAMAPRGCSARLLIAKDTEAMVTDSARVTVETLPFSAQLLPFVWRSSTTARPLDGELVHAITPLSPLRSRTSDDGTQVSIMVPHALAWLAPEVLGKQQAKLYRTYIKRAVKMADMVLAPNHATAQAIWEHYGSHVPVQVLQLAAPTQLHAPSNAAERRIALGLPQQYVFTSATANEFGRLNWLLDAMESDPALPHLVHWATDGETLPQLSDTLSPRVTLLREASLPDVAAAIDGAMLLALPQSVIGTGYEVLAALHAAVPVLHADCTAVAEISLEGGISAADATAFVDTLKRLTQEASSAELQQLSLYAEDRSRSYSWASTAWQLWELHANL